MKAQICAGFAILAAIGVGTALLVQSRTGTAMRHSDTEWKELNAKVERLELTTSQLQKELDDKRKSLSAFTMLRPVDTLKPSVIMNPIVPRTEAPPGSAPFVFNGITYYVTPLASAR
jgi:hypothetical protein